jgi:hypothetical protein
MAKVKEGNLTLLPRETRNSREANAAIADLKFLAAYLGGMEFRVGQRFYALRKCAVTVEDSKTAQMLKTIAVSRLETVLNSLADISGDFPKPPNKRKHRPRRLLISAIVATETED